MEKVPTPLLSNLDSLKILSLPVFQPKTLSFKDVANYLQVPVSNKITKVNVGRIAEVDQIYFLINLCSHMHHLQIFTEREWNYIYLNWK